MCLVASQIGGQPHDDMLRVPVPPQTKVPLYGDHISSRKAQAMKQAKDRKKQLAKLGPASNLAPLSIDKLDPHFVSDVEITKMHTKVNKIRKEKKTLTVGFLQDFEQFFIFSFFSPLNEQTLALQNQILHTTACGFSNFPDNF